MKLTTGYEFQGYYITDYLDVIFDEILVGLGFGKSIISGFDNMLSSLTGSEATAMIDKLNDVKYQLRDRVIAKANKLGANGMIGIDFESSKLGDLIMVSMTATAVKIDKIVNPLPTTQRDMDLANDLAKQAKLEEAKRQQLENLQANLVNFDAVHFIDALKVYSTTREMVEYINQAAKKHPQLFTDELLKELEGFVRMERLYGRGFGNSSTVKTLKEHFGIKS